MFIEQRLTSSFLLGPPYPGPPPRAPHLPMDTTRVHPSDQDVIYQKPPESYEFSNSLEDSQLPFSYDVTTESVEVNSNANKDSELANPSKNAINQQPPTIIVVQQPAPQSYMPNPYYGNQYQVIRGVFKI